MLSGFTACPGLFYATSAQDGILSRLRIPGGILNSKQCEAIANIADIYGGGYVDVTNRANLQIREIHHGINGEVLKQLQDLGLGSRNSMVDHIRNIMTSPTAGIDPEELIDTRPFVQSWDDYITAHPELSGLSAKFSVCFDGGGKVSVSDRLNDILLAAELIDNQVYFRLHLGITKGKPPVDTGILLFPEQCLSVLAVLADVYANHLDINSQRQPRLRTVVNNLGWENYLQQVEQRLTFPLLRGEKLMQKPHIMLIDPPFQSYSVHTSQITPLNPTPLATTLGTKATQWLPLERGEMSQSSSLPLIRGGLGRGKQGKSFYHIGIHPQRQQNLFYIGVVLPLGRLESWQLRHLADLAAKYGIGAIRLTPWQNLLITDIPQESVIDVQNAIADINIDTTASNIKSALVACSGKSGCAAAATETKAHALMLADYLTTRVKLDCPMNIHFTGCEKSCARHDNSDITLLGASDRHLESYHIYVGDRKNYEKFGRQIYQYVSFAEIPALIEQMLKAYQTHRLNPAESFAEFVHRYGTTQLKQLLPCSNAV